MKYNTTEIRKTDEICIRVLERIGTHNSLLTIEHIIELLKHFKILTELPSDDGIAYFMPCLLQPDYSPARHCRLCAHLPSLFALIATTFP